MHGSTASPGPVYDPTCLNTRHYHNPDRPKSTVRNHRMTFVGIYYFHSRGPLRGHRSEVLWAFAANDLPYHLTDLEMTWLSDVLAPPLLRDGILYSVCNGAVRSTNRSQRSAAARQYFILTCTYKSKLLPAIMLGLDLVLCGLARISVVFS